MAECSVNPSQTHKSQHAVKKGSSSGLNVREITEIRNYKNVQKHTDKFRIIVKHAPDSEMSCYRTIIHHMYLHHYCLHRHDPSSLILSFCHLFKEQTAMQNITTWW